MLKILAVIPARIGSSRLPKKVLADIEGKSMIQRVIESCLSAKLPQRVVLCTDNKDIAAVKMEVVRSSLPLKGYLEEIKDICEEKKILLIFDECTSGFREFFGGIHLKYKIYPDILILN